MESASLLIPRLSDLSKALENPETLASGSRDVQDAALKATQCVFDISLQSETSSRTHIIDLLSSITPSQAPQTRSQTRANATRPRSPPSPKAIFTPTPLISLFVEDMHEDQIWAQLDLRTKHICELLDFVLEGDIDEMDESEEGYGPGLRDALKALAEEQDVESDDDDGDDNTGSDESDLNEGGFEAVSDQDEASSAEEGLINLNETSSEEEEEDLEVPIRKTLHSVLSRRGHKGHSELDDGFFDLSLFNAETERGESRTASRGHLAESDESDDELMDVDLFTPIDDAEIGDEEVPDTDSKELFYKDFFESPLQRQIGGKGIKSAEKKSSQVRFNDEVYVKKIRPSGKNKPLRGELFFADLAEDSEKPIDGTRSPSNDISEVDMDEYGSKIEESFEEGDEDEDEDEEGLPSDTIGRLRDDLFAEDVDDSTENLTTHESRMADLRKQIEELESENVSNRHWTLMGEAGSRARPQNSLLEEDLEFDRVMKAVPVITEEAVQTLEEVIKSRILEGRFDDVVRLRPFDDKPFLPSRILELQDSKSTQSLAQIYENEYVAARSGDATIDDRDGKLKKEHDEIEQLWEKISGKLDALCNAFFVPKQVKSTISTVSNISTATLESALPTTKSATAMLAPEEVFSTQVSQLRARSELTPSEKRTRRVKERKSKKKLRDVLHKSVDKFSKKNMGNVKKQKEAALESIIKHGKGVTVVGKSKESRPRGRSAKS